MGRKISKQRAKRERKIAKKRKDDVFCLCQSCIYMRRRWRGLIGRRRSLLICRKCMTVLNADGTIGATLE